MKAAGVSQQLFLASPSDTEWRHFPWCLRVIGMLELPELVLLGLNSEQRSRMRTRGPCTLVITPSPCSSSQLYQLWYNPSVLGSLVERVTEKW